MNSNGPIWSNQTLTELKQVGVMRTSRSLQMLYMAGDKAEYIYFILAGFVNTFRMNAAGRKFLLGKYEAPSVIGLNCLSANSIYTAFAELHNGTQYIAVHQIQLWNFLEKHPDVWQFLLQISVNEIENLERRLEDTAFLGVRARLASLLLQISDNRNTMVIKGLSHRELAEMLGTHRETLTQTMNDLKQDGVLHTSRLNIELLDIENLRQISKRM